MKKIILILLFITISCNNDKIEECDCSQYEQELQLKPNGQITICHKGKTIVIDVDSWLEHESHGDSLGECTTLSVDDYEYDYCKDWCKNNTK